MLLDSAHKSGDGQEIAFIPGRTKSKEELSP